MTLKSIVGCDVKDAKKWERKEAQAELFVCKHHLLLSAFSQSMGLPSLFSEKTCSGSLIRD